MSTYDLTLIFAAIYVLFIVAGIYIVMTNKETEFVITEQNEVWYNNKNDDIVVFNSQYNWIMDKNELVIDKTKESLVNNGYEKIGVL